MKENYERKSKIGFFEKWNVDAERVEFSMTRLQMAVLTLFTMVFVLWFFVGKGNEVTFENVLLVLVLLIACYTPKALKDLMDLRRSAGKKTCG